MREQDDFSDILTLGPNACSLRVRAKPNARQAGICLLVLSDNSRIVEVKINSIPEDGRANKAICEALADALHLKKSAVSIKMGATNRNKVIEFAGSADHLTAPLRAWLSSLPRTGSVS